jgi:hypothetical protein
MQRTCLGRWDGKAGFLYSVVCKSWQGRPTVGNIQTSPYSTTRWLLYIFNDDRSLVYRHHCASLLFILTHLSSLSPFFFFHHAKRKVLSRLRSTFLAGGGFNRHSLFRRHPYNPT